MKYIKFYNIITESLYDGFLVKQVGEKYETIDPICYEWVQQTGNWAWLDVLDTRKFDTEFFPYHEGAVPKDGQFIGEYTWLFDFPVKEKHVPKLHSIANFFEWFAGTKNMPLHAKLTLCIDRTKHVLSPDIAQDVCDFITDYYRSHPDRLRILLHG